MLGVCLSVCLSVCLLATLRTNYWTDVHENFTTECTCTRNNRLTFGIHSSGSAIQEFFWMILQHCEIGHFPTIWLISPESDRIFVKILSQMHLWTGKSPLNFGGNPDPESVGSRPYSPWRTMRSLTGHTFRGPLKAHFVWLMLRCGAVRINFYSSTADRH